MLQEPAARVNPKSINSQFLRNVLKANGVGKKHGSVFPTTVKKQDSLDPPVNKHNGETRDYNEEQIYQSRIKTWKNRRDYSSPTDATRDQFQEAPPGKKGVVDLTISSNDYYKTESDDGCESERARYRRRVKPGKDEKDDIVDLTRDMSAESYVRFLTL
jgi:hypothetical protein